MDEICVSMETDGFCCKCSRSMDAWLLESDTRSLVDEHANLIVYRNWAYACEGSGA